MTLASRRAGVLALLTLAILAARLVPTPPPAQASLCGTPVISVICSIVSGTAGGLKWTVNTSSGTVSVFNRVVGSVVNSGTGLACKWLAEGWMQKTICPLAKAAVGAANKAGSAAKNAGAGAAANGASGTASTQTDQNSAAGALSTTALAAGAALFLGLIGHEIGKATTVDVTAGWFHSVYGQITAAVAGLLTLMLILTALLSIVSHRDPSALRAALLRVPKAILTTAAVAPIIGLLIALSDGLGIAVAGPSMHQATHVLHVLAGAFVALGLAAKLASVTGHGTFAHILGTPAWIFAGVACLASLLMLLELGLRAVGIYAALLFVPIVMAGAIWPRFEGAESKLGGLLGALIATKLVFIIMLTAAASAIATGGIGGIEYGAAFLLLIIFAPWVFIRLFPFGEHHFHRGQVAPGGPPISMSSATFGDRMHYRADQAAQAHAPVPPPPPPGPPPAGTGAPPPVPAPSRPEPLSREPEEHP